MKGRNIFPEKKFFDFSIERFFALCLCVRERKGECICVCEIEREAVCEYLYERERGAVCVYLYERDR